MKQKRADEKPGRISRRSFLQGSAYALAGAGASGALGVRAAQAAVGANERVNLALVGCGGRGSLDIRGLVVAGARVTHLCDLNKAMLEKTAAFLAEVQDEKPKLVQDMRAVFDSNVVDGVVVATPDHWHAPAAIMACQAGKDVYVEKPHAHNLWESRQLVSAARKYKRIVQVGTQNRSGAYNKAAREYIESGALGQIPLVKVYNMKPGKAFYLGDPGPMPADFDWDVWLGPAPKRDWHQNVYKRGWHKFWEYSDGDMSDDGIHQIDLAMMLMGNPGLPKRVSCMAGRFVHRDDDGVVPDTQEVTYEFDNFLMTFDLTGYPKYMRKTTATIRRNDELPYWTQNATRIELYGSELMMTVGRHGGGWQVTTEGGRVVEQMYGRPCDEEHYENFLACVKNRKKPNAQVDIAHPSAALVYAANIAHRVGNTTLEFDGQRERFKGNAAANKLLRRSYRKGYAVPEEV